MYQMCTSCLRSASSRSLFSLASLLALSSSALFLFSSSEDFAMFSNRALRFPAPTVAINTKNRLSNIYSVPEQYMNHYSTVKMHECHCITTHMYNFQRPVQQTLTGLESLRLFISWWWWLHLTEGSCTLWEKNTLIVHSLGNCPTKWIMYGIPFLPYWKKKKEENLKEFISHRITMHFAFATLFFVIAPLCKSCIVTLYLTAVIIFL